MTHHYANKIGNIIRKFCGLDNLVCSYQIKHNIKNYYNNYNSKILLLHQHYRGKKYKFLKDRMDEKLFEVLLQRKDKLSWKLIKEFIKDKDDKWLMNNIEWYDLSANSCDDAVDLLLKYPQKIKYGALSTNSNERIKHLLNKDTIASMSIFDNKNIMWSSVFFEYSLFVFCISKNNRLFMFSGDSNIDFGRYAVFPIIVHS